MNKLTKLKRKDLLKIMNCKQKGMADEDFYLDAKGNIVLTAFYHEKRGYCCKKWCQHCPWRIGETIA